MFSKNQKISPIFLLCIVLFLNISCGMNENESDMTPITSANSRSLSNFDFLKSGMSYEEIVSRVGEADDDIGSGLHIMVYELSDGKQIFLTFASFESLLAASLYNPENETGERLNIEE